MSCGKGRKSVSLCPFSFGLALGLTLAITIVIWSVWVMKFGMPSTMTGHMMPPTQFSGIAVLAGWGLLKGFLFGFVLALLYDFIACCCKAKCCRKSEGTGTCGCGNPSCACGNPSCGCGGKSKTGQ